MNARAQTNAPDPAEFFASQGFLEPFPVYTAEQCKLILDHFRSASLSPPHAWSKGYASSNPLLYDISVQPALLEVLKKILGPDIVLWGVSLVERDPEAVHPWHTDIESSAIAGGFASVWIGIENTSVDSGLHLISRSHLLAKPIQQVVQEHGANRKDASASVVEAWAKELDPKAQLVQPPVRDGEAIVFDGRLWHGSKNMHGKRRAALLLQYVRADTPVFIPDFSDFTWPFHFTKKRPPSVLVSGTGNPAGHDLLLPPTDGPTDPAFARADLPRVGRLPDARDTREGRKDWTTGLRKFFKKVTRSVTKRFKAR